VAITGAASLLGPKRLEETALASEVRKEEGCLGLTSVDSAGKENFISFLGVSVRKAVAAASVAAFKLEDYHKQAMRYSING